MRPKPWQPNAEHNARQGARAARRPTKNPDYPGHQPVRRFALHRERNKRTKLTMTRINNPVISQAGDKAANLVNQNSRARVGRPTRHRTLGSLVLREMRTAQAHDGVGPNQEGHLPGIYVARGRKTCAPPLLTARAYYHYHQCG